MCFNQLYKQIYFSTTGKSPRSEILININPTAPLVGENLYPDLYDVRVSSAVISGQWKLITGDPWGDDAAWMQGEQINFVL